MKPPPEFFEQPEPLAFGEALGLVVAWVASASLAVVGLVCAWRWISA